MMVMFPGMTRDSDYVTKLSIDMIISRLSFQVPTSFRPNMLPSHLFNSGASGEFFGTSGYQNEQGGWDTSQNIEALVGPQAGPSHPFNSAAPGESFGTTVRRNESNRWDTIQNIEASQNAEVVGYPAGRALTWAEVVNQIHPLDLEALLNMSPSFAVPAPAPAPMPSNLGIPAAAVQTAEPGRAMTWAEVINNIHPLNLETIINISPIFPALAPMPSDLGIPAAPVQTSTIHPHTFLAPAPELFSSIRVDGVFEEDMKEYLQRHLPNARQLHIFMMDLCNVSWNTMFTQPAGRWPTPEMCEKIMDQTCRRRRSNNPRWKLEQGTITTCFSHRYNLNIIVSQYAVVEAQEARTCVYDGTRHHTVYTY